MFVCAFRYEEQVREQRNMIQKEDLSDMVAEHAAKQKVCLYQWGRRGGLRLRRRAGLGEGGWALFGVKSLLYEFLPPATLFAQSEVIAIYEYLYVLLLTRHLEPKVLSLAQCLRGKVFVFEKIKFSSVFRIL